MNESVVTTADGRRVVSAAPAQALRLAAPPVVRWSDGTADFTSQRFTFSDIWRDLVAAVRPRRRPPVPTHSPTTADVFDRLAWPAEVR